MTALRDAASAVVPILRASVVASVLLPLAPSAAGAEAAALLAQGCLGCHGPGGSGSGGIPAIAGRPAAEVRDLMRAFREDERPATIMNRIARGYTDPEIAAIARHFAGQD
jgi:sulfide dehydrogenase cytochrome subunit